MATLARPNSAARLKEELEVTKLRTDILFVKLTFFAQIVNTLGLATLGVLAFLYFQRPQIEQMEISRLANEKQQVSALAMSALALENPQDRASMLNAVHTMYPQYEFLGSLVRSQTVLTQVAAASASPEAKTLPNPNTEAPPPSKVSRADYSLENLKKAREKLDEAEVRIARIEEQCQIMHESEVKLERTLYELAQVMEKELSGSAGTRKAGRGAAYQSLYEQATKVKAELHSLQSFGRQYCAEELPRIKEEREALLRQIDEMMRSAFQ
jgi:hypothetical protein